MRRLQAPSRGACPLAQLRRSSRRSVRPVRRSCAARGVLYAALHAAPCQRSGPQHPTPSVPRRARRGRAQPQTHERKSTSTRDHFRSFDFAHVRTPGLEACCRPSEMRTCRHGQNRHLPSVSGAPRGSEWTAHTANSGTGHLSLSARKPDAGVLESVPTRFALR